MIPRVVDDIPIQVNRTRRQKTAEFSLRDGQVRVLVPDRLSNAEINRLIQRRMPWIREKMRQQESAPRMHPKEYVSGESFAYLGRNYRLKIVQDVEEGVKLKSGGFVVSISGERDSEERGKRVHDLLERWYVDHALDRLQEKIDRYGRIMDVTPASIFVKGYRSRWGSCTHTGNIGFNWRIIIAPHTIVDYVVVHELGHILQHDHSDAFWLLVRRVIPDFQERRRWLKEHGHLLTM